MIPLRIHAENFATYPVLDWEIPQGLSAVLGRNGLSDGVDSNGAGKSSLLAAIPVALFGGLPEYLTAGEEACSVELEFEHGGETFRVRRSYSAKGRGKSTLDFQMLTAAGTASEPPDVQDRTPAVSGTGPAAASTWEPLTQDSITATDALIARTIGLSQSTFTHSVFAAQDAPHFADPSLAPRERKEILADALGLDVWDRLLDLVRADIRDAETEDATLRGRVAELASDIGDETELAQALQSAEGARDHAVHQVELAEAAVGEVAARLASVEQAEGERRRLEAEAALAASALRAVQERQAAVVRARGEMVELVPRIDALVDRATPRAALEEQLRAAEAAQAERAHMVERLEGERLRGAEARQGAQAHAVKAAELLAQAAKVEAEPDAHCRECGQPIAGEAKERSLEALRRDWQLLEAESERLLAEAKTHEAEAERLKGSLPADRVDVEGLRGLVGAAREAEIALARARDRLEALRVAAVEVPTEELAAAVEADRVAAGGLAGCEPALPGRVAELRGEQARAVAAVQAARVVAGQAEGEVVRCEERLQRAASLAERHAETLAAISRLHGRLGLLGALEAAYGRNGIPALILESAAVPQIEAEAQRVLAELGVGYRVELVTQRETKAGSLRDTLDVVVHEPSGPRRYETYSGGERTRIEFALRIALARLVASRRGAEAGILVLDELSYLDAAGMAQVASVLRGLSEFRSVILVSHDDRLSDAFDQQIVVVRDEAGSRLEEVSA